MASAIGANLHTLEELSQRGSAYNENGRDIGVQPRGVGVETPLGQPYRGPDHSFVDSFRVLMVLF